MSVFSYHFGSVLDRVDKGFTVGLECSYVRAILHFLIRGRYRKGWRGKTDWDTILGKGG